MGCLLPSWIHVEIAFLSGISSAGTSLSAEFHEPIVLFITTVIVNVDRGGFFWKLVDFFSRILVVPVATLTPKTKIVCNPFHYTCVIVRFCFLCIHFFLSLTYMYPVNP